MENSDPKNIGININVDASGADQGIKQAENKLDELSSSVDKQAAAITRNEAATKAYKDRLAEMSANSAAAAVDTKKLDAELTALLSRINPAYAAVMKLDQGTDLLQQGLSHGLITNQQYTSSIGLLESSLVKANIETGNAITMTARARAEMVVAGREIAQGNFSRLPGTLSIIAQGLSPIALGIGAVTALLAAGGSAWYKWGDDAEANSRRVANSLNNVLAAAEEGAKNSKHLNQYEQIAEIDKEILKLEEDNNKKLADLDDKKRIRSMGSHNQLLADQIAYLEKTTAANNQNLENLKRNAADIAATLESGNPDKPAKASKLDKLLEETKRFDEAMVESHKDAFTKTIDKWVEMENKLIAEGAKGATARKAHEAAYTAFVKDESDKRIADASKEKEAKDKHLAAQLASEQAYWAEMSAAAGEATQTAEGREMLRFEKDIINMEKRRAAAAADHQLTLDEIDGFEQAKEDIIAAHQNRQKAAATDVVKFDMQLRAGNYSDAMKTAKNMTAGLATHSRAAFEINKLASQASIIVDGYKATSKAYDYGLETTGSPWGGAAYAAVTAAFYAAQLMAVNSTQFGGGGSVSAPGGGGVPSLATTPGTPVNVQPPPAGTAAPAAQNVNITIVGNESTVFSYEQVVNQLIPAINAAAGNGVNITVNV